MQYLQQLETVERLKISCLSRGIRISETCKRLLTDGGRVPLTLHEYATTGGVTFVIGDDVYVNAPFDGWFEDTGVAMIDVDTDERLVIHFDDEVIPVERMLQLPGYREQRLVHDHLVTDIAMSHGDRVRVSPIRGCVFDCHFCDLPGRLTYYEPEVVIAGLHAASQTNRFPQGTR